MASNAEEVNLKIKHKWFWATCLPQGGESLLIPPPTPYMKAEERSYQLVYTSSLGEPVVASRTRDLGSATRITTDWVFYDTIECPTRITPR